MHFLNTLIIFIIEIYLEGFQANLTETDIAKLQDGGLNLLSMLMEYSSMTLIAQECCDSCKIYLSPQSVMISNNGIIVNLDGIAGITDMIQHDINGLYIDEGRVQWIDREGHYNPPEKPVCPKCSDENKTFKEREKDKKK